MEQAYFETLAGVIYGEKYTRHDLKNIRTKFTPIFDGTDKLSFTNQTHSDDYTMDHYALWQRCNSLLDCKFRGSKAIKDNKKATETFKFMVDKQEKLEARIEELKEQNKQYRNQNEIDVEMSYAYREIKSELGKTMTELNTYKDQFEDFKKEKNDAIFEHAQYRVDEDDRWTKRVLALEKKIRKSFTDEAKYIEKKEMSLLSTDLKESKKEIKLLKKKIKALKIKNMELTDSDDSD